MFLFDVLFCKSRLSKMEPTKTNKIKIDQNCKIRPHILDIWCKNVRWKCRESKEKLYYVFFCKSRLSKMASAKTNKIEKRTPLPKTNFLSYTTLLLGPKRFVHSKGPKIALCLCYTWLSLDMVCCTFDVQYRGWVIFNSDKVQF